MTPGKKSSILIVSLLIGMAAGFSSMLCFESQLTDWQKNQEVSFEKNTGSTKFLAYVNAATVGLGSFGLSACAILATIRLRNMGRHKK